MKLINLKTLSFVTLFMVLALAKSQAQTGNVQGTISDENGIYVPGANVMISELSQGVITDFNGKFTLVGIPEGSYILDISFLGYESIEQEVTVSANETTSVTLTMRPKSLELNEVQVTAYGLSGQAKALNRQKTNMKISNVVSTDQIGKFPDANIGDAVKRIPGITIQVDQGEARNIIVRGLSPQLNSVTLNGSRIPSAEGDNRNIQMDLIPSDMIQTIEVSKAVTPDMEADALGGSVNLVTRTSPQGFRVAATLGSGVNFITNKRIWNGSFLIGDRTKNDKFGWMVAASINDNDFGSDNVEAEWSDEAESPLTEEDIEIDPYVAESDIRTYLVQRVRRSFSANFDYKFDANNSIFLKTMYNWRDDRENRYRLRFNDIEPVFADGTENVIGFEGALSRQTKGGIPGGRIQNTRLEDQRMQNYSLGGDHLFGKLKVNWMVSYASASEDRPNERYAQYEQEDAIAISADLMNPRYPSFRPANAADGALSTFLFDEITEENQFTEEEDMNAFINFELPADFFGQGNGMIKFGGLARLKDKVRDNNFFEFTPLTGGFDSLADVETVNQTDPDFLAGSQYAAGSYFSPALLGSLDLFDTAAFDGSPVPDEFLRANFDVQEDVFAGYLMANQKVSDKLSVLAGLRVENTSITAKGNRILDEEDLIGEVTDESSYTNILPGVHFKYNFSDRTILRLAWTNTLARPNYVDLVPTLDIVNEDEEIFLGNSELDPTTSMNFDVMAEHYFTSVGLVSGGVFYKSIDNFIYTSVFEAQDNSLGENTEGYNIFQPQNGDAASITGLEVSFQRQLDFLPGFAKNFNIFLNYTHITSNAEGIRNEDGDERDDIDLPNTSPNMFNGSLAYSGKRMNLRLSANFSDAYIDEIGGRPFEDRFYDKQFFLDFNAIYAINRNLSVYLDLNNIVNQPLRYYQGVTNRTQQVEFYDRRLTFGLKYDLFKKK
ncbi:TonB-dependent receptor [Flagellimonas sp. HMM57]|uniref:TonB-dependent receptor n=1 Tax=unclassified Flagellimonas TaxID=2644544 RepID=UPI001969BCCD|nr:MULTISPECIES: TonB-dependent receptor [unclassified Flagellimonas]UII74511.1 TonB-dependent receptor [Flagellimonas sp. HMM57]